MANRNDEKMTKRFKQHLKCIHTSCITETNTKYSSHFQNLLTFTIFIRIRIQHASRLLYFRPQQNKFDVRTDNEKKKKKTD